MKRWMVPALVLAAIALAITAVACSSSKSTKTNATSTPKKTAVSTPVSTKASQTQQSTSTPQSTASSQTTPGGSTLKITQNATLGTIVTDAAGRTVYKYANDQAGTSNCTGTCAQNWPPVKASGQPTAGTGVTGQVGTIQRADGTTQVTLDGLPLYYFVSDSSPGAATGDGVGGFSVIMVGD